VPSVYRACYLNKFDAECTELRLHRNLEQKENMRQLQRLFAAGLCLLLSATVFAQSGRIVKVPDATSLRLSLMEALNSATNNVDDPVRFEVTEDVKVGNDIVFPKGSTAVGHVVEVEPRRRLGRAGKLNFSIDHVKAPDGSNLRLRASTTRKGDDKTGTVIVGTVLLSPLFLIMRGKDVSIPKGTDIAAYVDGDREVTLPTATGSPAASSPAARSTVSAAFKSTPDGADVIVDGKYAGSTPSTLQLAVGDHKISMEKLGFKGWQRAITVNAGSDITMNATLENQ